MKTMKKDEIKMDSIRKEIKVKEANVKEMIKCLDEWKDSNEIRKLLLGQIRRTNYEIKMMGAKLKVMNLIQGFKTKVTA